MPRLTPTDRVAHAAKRRRKRQAKRLGPDGSQTAISTMALLHPVAAPRVEDGAQLRRTGEAAADDLRQQRLAQKGQGAGLRFLKIIGQDVHDAFGITLQPLGLRVSSGKTFPSWCRSR